MSADGIYLSDHVDQAAALIGEPHNLPWLRGHLQSQVISVANYLHSDTNAPKREDHIARAREILSHAHSLKSKLNEPTMRYLQHVTSYNHVLAALPAILEDLCYRLNVDLDVVARQKKSGKEERVRPTKAHEPAYIIESHVLAAAVCMGTWIVVHGKPPGVTNLKAQDATQAIWQAAGGIGGKKWLPIMRQAVAQQFLIDRVANAARVACLLGGA